MSWTKGKHDLRFGGEYVYTRDNRTFGAYENAVEALNGAGGVPGDLENFLTGTAGWFQVVVDSQGKFPVPRTRLERSYKSFVHHQSADWTAELRRSNRFNDMAFYGQDTWKVTPRLTLNLGLALGVLRRAAQ